MLLALGTQLRRMPLLDGAHLLLRRLLLRVDSLCAQRSSEARSMEASSECSRLAVRAFYRVSIPRAPPRSHKVRPSLRAACAPSLAPGESRCTSSAACATHCVRLAACNATALVPPARDQRESLLLLVQGHLLRLGQEAAAAVRRVLRSKHCQPGNHRQSPCLLNGSVARSSRQGDGNRFCRRRAYCSFSFVSRRSREGDIRILKSTPTSPHGS